MTDTHVHHAVDYLEIPALDLTATQEFYASAFGWSFTAYGPDYVGFTTSDGREGGGLSAAEEVTVGSLLPILFSADLDATRAAVIAAGGTIVEDVFDFPGGRRFHFSDPSGNVLAVWGEPEDH